MHIGVEVKTTPAFYTEGDGSTKGFFHRPNSYFISSPPQTRAHAHAVGIGVPPFSCFAVQTSERRLHIQIYLFLFPPLRDLGSTKTKEEYVAGIKVHFLKKKDLPHIIC